MACLMRRETLDRLSTWIDAVGRTAGFASVVVGANKADLVAYAAFGQTDAALAAEAHTADAFMRRRRQEPT